MPPVAQPGNRAGLVSALVAFVVLFFIAAILWIYSWVEMSKKSKELDDLRNNYSKIISDSEKVGENVQALEDLRKNPDYSGRTIFDILWTQRTGMLKLLAGKETGVEDVLTAGKAALNSAAEKSKAAGVNVPTDSMINAMAAMSDAVVSRENRLAETNSKLVDATRQKALMEATQKAVLEAKDKQLADALADRGRFESETVAYRQQKDQQLTDSDAARAQAVSSATDAASKIASQLAGLQQENKRLKGDMEKLLIRYGHRRPDVKNSAVRQADGNITRLAGSGVVYINLGLGDRISPGMTFEVYDRVAGVPPLGEEEVDIETLPRGKGSIEVVRVGKNSSECRVVKASTLSPILEGDVIANLVYDRNISAYFKVYGEFDLDQNGVATPQETEIVRQLITQWGGQLTDDVSVSTDFVIMGVEPKIPIYSEEDLKDPVNANKLELAKKAADAFDAVRNKAQSLYIPVLNQNRFLCFIGYFDVARR